MSDVLTADQVRALLRAECDKAGNQRKWALAHAVSPQFVGDVLLGHRLPGSTMSAALGIVENPRTWRLDNVR